MGAFLVHIWHIYILQALDLASSRNLAIAGPIVQRVLS